jgi:hypothetical protein
MTRPARSSTESLIAVLPRVVTATAEMRCIKLARFHTATVRITRVRFTVTLRLTG